MASDRKFLGDFCSTLTTVTELGKQTCFGFDRNRTEITAEIHLYPRDRTESSKHTEITAEIPAKTTHNHRSTRVLDINPTEITAEVHERTTKTESFKHICFGSDRNRTEIMAEIHRRTTKYDAQMPTSGNVEAADS